MAFTKEEKRDLRAKRKREREADEALRGVKRQPRGRPPFGCGWDNIAGEWTDRREFFYAALAQGGVIETSWERITPHFTNDDGTLPSDFLLQRQVRRFATRADAETWLQSEVKSTTGAPCCWPCRPPCSEAND